jgi:hypothetical protein
MDYRCFVRWLEAIHKNFKAAYKYLAVDINIISHGFKVQNLLSPYMLFVWYRWGNSCIALDGQTCCNKTGLGLSYCRFHLKVL